MASNLVSQILGTVSSAETTLGNSIGAGAAAQATPQITQQINDKFNILLLIGGAAFVFWFVTTQLPKKHGLRRRARSR